MKLFANLEIYYVSIIRILYAFLLHVEFFVRSFLIIICLTATKSKHTGEWNECKENCILQL